MGRISSIYRSCGARPESACVTDAADRLRGVGALAGMDGSSDHRCRNHTLPSPHQDAAFHRLTAILSSLHPDPSALAARLLNRFGTIARIANASEGELRQASADGENWVGAVVGVRQLVHDGVRERLVRTRLSQDRSNLLSYLMMTMRSLSEERLIAIFADAMGFVIAEEVLADGTEDHVQITPRRIFGRALKLDARRIILAHNHPSGSATPSPSDVEHTQRLCRQAKELDLIIDDHLIIGACDIVSMKDRGLIG